MISVLHTDMEALEVAEAWLEDSEWTDTLTEVGISGAHSFFTASHVTNTMHDNQVIGASLYTLQQNANAKYISGSQVEVKNMDVDVWCKMREDMSPALILVNCSTT